MWQRSLFPLLLVMVLTVGTLACTPSIRAVGRSVEAGAVEAQREIASMRDAGEIDQDAARQFTAGFSEIESNGHSLSLIVNWNAMSRADKRRTIVQQIGQFEASAKRLDEAGVLGIKSARARKRVETFKRNFQRGLGALRIIEAAIPDEQ